MIKKKNQSEPEKVGRCCSYHESCLTESPRQLHPCARLRATSPSSSAHMVVYVLLSAFFHSLAGLLCYFPPPCSFSSPARCRVTTQAVSSRGGLFRSSPAGHGFQMSGLSDSVSAFLLLNRPSEGGKMNLTTCCSSEMPLIGRSAGPHRLSGGCFPKSAGSRQQCAFVKQVWG